MLGLMKGTLTRMFLSGERLYLDTLTFLNYGIAKLNLYIKLNLSVKLILLRTKRKYFYFDTDDSSFKVGLTQGSLDGSNIVKI